VLHFTGYAAHNSENPNTFALYLAHDHPFTLEDLNSLPTIPIPLICLAACETGITATGEFIDEFVGFPAVFLKKGSQTILSTLWTVNETSSMIFVVEFFRHYQTHHNPTAAFHHAQTQLQTLTWSDLAQWYRDAIQTDLDIEAEMWLNSLANNIDNDPEQSPPHYSPYADPYHWAGFVLHGS
jgi:CHAT domain-containing protein